MYIASTPIASEVVSRFIRPTRLRREGVPRSVAQSSPGKNVLLITLFRDVSAEYPRVFRTGDYAKIVKGSIIYEGRVDSQIKIRGHRVDLTEVERAIARIPDIDKVVVLCYKPGELSQVNSGSPLNNFAEFFERLLASNLHHASRWNHRNTGSYLDRL